MKMVYDKAFYETRDLATTHFSDRLASIITDLFAPTSAVDLGCGVGTLLRHLKLYGITKILGMEGPWLDSSQLVIDSTEFQYADLTQPLHTDRNFDVAISLEVAEHIESKYADTFVNSLCDLSAHIVFSAAIPKQGGVHHVNEQWQSYWAEKFMAHGYKAFDFIRPIVWSDNAIPTHYRQNIIVYVEAQRASAYPALSQFEVTDLALLDQVHPDMYLAHAKNPESISYRELLQYFPTATLAALSRVAKRIVGR